jgi:hypothetical protein
VNLVGADLGQLTLSDSGFPFQMGAYDFVESCEFSRKRLRMSRKEALRIC